MTKLAPEWVRTSDPVIRSPARYCWTTVPTSQSGGGSPTSLKVLDDERQNQMLLRKHKFNVRMYDFISCTDEWQTPNNTVSSLLYPRGITITTDGRIILGDYSRVIMIEDGCKVSIYFNDTSARLTI